MHIRHLHLQNFRCYDNLSLGFRPGINLLIGDNASGKTTVLRACRYVMSAFFAGYSDDNTRWACPTADDFAQRVADGVVQPEQPVVIQFDMAGCAAPGPHEIRKNSKKNSRALVSGLTAYRNYTRHLRDDGEPLPLFASFSTEYIHATRKIDTNKFKPYDQKASFGYYECLDGSGFLPYWLKRLLVLQEARKGQREIETVRRAVADCMGTDGCGVIQGMDIRPQQGEVYYTFCDGREVPAPMLSDGYRRIANIVTDLACRCALLNGRLYGPEAAKRTTGTAVIDEIDMHLHPAMQARVLKGLTQAFPCLQFIATTHAPMVMTNVQDNDRNTVFHLGFDGKTYRVAETSTYGMDASSITEVVLRQTPRAESVDLQLANLFDAIDNDRTQEAQILLQEMRKQFGGTLPELTRAETMLHFLTSDDYEED